MDCIAYPTHQPCNAFSGRGSIVRLWFGIRFDPDIDVVDDRMDWQRTDPDANGSWVIRSWPGRGSVLPWREDAVHRHRVPVIGHRSRVGPTAEADFAESGDRLGRLPDQGGQRNDDQQFHSGQYLQGCGQPLVVDDQTQVMPEVGRLLRRDRVDEPEDDEGGSDRQAQSR
jgi:hypothetical protein